ncbi:carotenoid oxygenase [Gongronella butleri]|nr:carotenoid oxygenase [Gongronella butleri]
MASPSLDQFFTQGQLIDKCLKAQYTSAPEFNEPIWLDVQGEIPSWLQGVLYRIGPGKFTLGEKDGKSLAITHAFDGLAYVHRFEFNGKNQTFRYNSRCTAKTYEKNILANPFGGHSSYANVWDKGNAWQHFMDFLARSKKSIHNLEDASARSINVTVTPGYPLPPSFDNQGAPVLVSKTDSNILQKVHHDTLEPERLFDYSFYNGKLDGRLSAAHHQHDVSTGETFNFVMSVGPNPKLTVFKISKTGETTILAEITDNLDANNTPFRPSYMHAFWITQNYVIVPVAPNYVKNHGLDLAVTGNLLAGMEWDSTAPNLFYVVSRQGGHVATVPVEQHFAFHTLHGRDYTDENGNAVLELNNEAFANGNVLFGSANLADVARSTQKKIETWKYNLFYLCRVPDVEGFSKSFGDLRQYKIVLDKTNPCTASTSSFKTLVKNIEFARIHPLYQFEKFDHVYFNFIKTGEADKRGDQYGIKKITFSTQQELVWEPDTNDAYICSEPVFVPRPGATDEDDGVVISLVNLYDNRGAEYDRCYILLLNSKDFTEYGRIPLGQFTATTFHGSFVDQEFVNGSFN